jgi:outer membrane receptor protein involved in Fe transport
MSIQQIADRAPIHSRELLVTWTARVAPSLIAAITLAAPLSLSAQEILITVTADAPNTESLPLSSTLLDTLDAAERGQRHLDELMDQIPNLGSSGGNSRARFFQIRGIGEVEQFVGAPNPSVSFMVDGLELSNLGALGSLFDLETVRVDRGPQGFTGGASSLAGRIQLESTPPQGSPAGFAELTAGSDSLFAKGLAFGGTIPGTRQLSVRGSLYHRQQDGFLDNEFLRRDDTNGRDEFSGRLNFHFQPAEETSLALSLLNLENDNGYDAFTITNTRTTQSDRPGQDRIHLRGGSLRVEHSFDAYLTLIGRGGLSEADQLYSYDGDWGNDPFWGENAPYDYFSRTDRSRRTGTAELALTSNAALNRFEDLTYQVGTFFERLRESTFQQDDASGSVYNELQSRFTDRRRAIYGNLTLPVLTDTALILGGRVEEQELSYSDSQETVGGDSNTELMGKVGLEHQLNSKWVISSDLRTGFRGGGINPGTRISPEERSYKPEQLTNVEFGARFTLLEGSWTGSTTAFWNTRRSQQVQTSRQDDPSDPLAYTYFIANASRGDGIGLEHQSRFQATERLQLNLSGALLRARYEGFQDLEEDRGSRDLAHAPRWEFAVGARYDLTARWFTRIDLTGKDRFYYGEGHDERSDPYALLGAAIGYDDGVFSAVLWGRNVLDETYATRGYFFGNEPPDFPNKLYEQRGEPAQVGLTVQYRF